MQEQLMLSEDPSLPSTPTSDVTSKRLSWGRLLQKLHSSQSLDSDSDNHSSVDDASETGSLSPSESDLFFDPSEEALCKEVVRLISENLSEAKDSVLRCSKLFIPEKLLEHMGQELVHLSSSEPCGLRGAHIDLCVEQGGSCEAVGQIAVDPCLVPTFHLTLVLRLDSKGLWPRIQGLFTGPSPGVRHALKLSTGFRVIKRKLYSSEELLIEEC